jgi:hypothetical protein
MFVKTTLNVSLTATLPGMTRSARSALAILLRAYHRFHEFADLAFCFSSNNRQCLGYSFNLSSSHRHGCDGGASFEPRKILPIAAHDCHRQAHSTSRHSAAFASRVPRVARLLGNIGLRSDGLAPHVSCASQFSCLLVHWV